jgi:hypothetical protein
MELGNLAIFEQHRARPHRKRHVALHVGRQPIGLRDPRHQRQRHDERHGRCPILVEIARIWLKQLRPPFERRPEVVREVR